MFMLQKTLQVVIHMEKEKRKKLDNNEIPGKKKSMPIQV